MLKLVVLTFAAGLLAGCQSRQIEPVTEPIDLSWLSGVENWSGPGERLTQLVTFEDRRNGRIHTARFDIELSRDKLIMVAQTTMGLPLYESVFSRGALTVQRHQTGELPVEPVIADFLLSTWPPEALMPALSRIGYTLTLNPDGRSLKDEAGRLQIEMRQATGDGRILHITHHDIPLTIRIQTLDRRPIP